MDGCDIRLATPQSGHVGRRRVVEAADDGREHAVNCHLFFVCAFFMVAICNRADHIYFHAVVCSSLWSPYGIGQTIIFLPCGYFFFYGRPM